MFVCLEWDCDKSKPEKGAERPVKRCGRVMSLLPNLQPRIVINEFNQGDRGFPIKEMTATPAIACIGIIGKHVHENSFPNSSQISTKKTNRTTPYTSPSSLPTPPSLALTLNSPFTSMPPSTSSNSAPVTPPASTKTSASSKRSTND